MILSKNAILFLYLFLVKTRLEKMFHIILDKKETFFGDKNIISLMSQKSDIFCKGVSPWVFSKMPLFSLFVLGQEKARTNVS